MSNIIKKEIIINPEPYFGTQQKSLEQRIEKVKLSDEEVELIIASKTTETIRDKVLGLFKVGEIVNTILNWNKEIDEDLKDAKKEYLLSEYFNKADAQEEAINKIKNILTKPQGNTLFNKILRILDNTPPDIELTGHLANALKHISNSDFYNLFDDHKYALNQIELLTPQALTILADFKNWPIMNIDSYSANGSKITSDWYLEFSKAYATSKGISTPKIFERINHSINDLIKNRYIEAHLVGQGNAKVVLTRIGDLLLPYLV